MRRHCVRDQPSKMRIGQANLVPGTIGCVFLGVNWTWKGPATACLCSRNQSVSPACSSALGPAAVPVIRIQAVRERDDSKLHLGNLWWWPSAITPCNRQVPVEPTPAQSVISGQTLPAKYPKYFDDGLRPLSGAIQKTYARCDVYAF